MQRRTVSSKIVTSLMALTAGAALWAGCGGATVMARVEVPRPPAPEHTEWTHPQVYVSFATGGHAIPAESRRQLTEVVQTARTNPNIVRVRIEGHTDTRGGERGNEALSVQRAEAVRDALIEEGVPPNIIEVVGFGSRHPIAVEGGHQQNMALNRRVEFSILMRRAGAAN